MAWEKQAIVDYHQRHPEEGYRRLTFMMLDEDIVAVSSNSVYRVLRAGGWLAVVSRAPPGRARASSNRWLPTSTGLWTSPTSIYYLCALLDGYSLYTVIFQ